MLKVFSELDFIYNEDGLIKINSHSSKRYRDESSLPIKTISNRSRKRLLYDDFSNIKNG